MTTIDEVKAQLERVLPGVMGELLPQVRGWAVQVELRENRRKKRSDASRESWRPEARGELIIRFCPPPQAPSTGDWPQAQGSAANSVAASTGERDTARDDLIRALDKAEQRPGYDFVALKWFRDQFLPAEEQRSGASAQTVWSDVLRKAIEEGLVLTSKVPNPTNPQFPTTAIRLNRLAPEVQAVLGESTGSLGFRPVRIRGEALSETILRERR